jgi:hypothetical protein
MRHQLAISIFAATLVALGTGSAVAKSQGGKGMTGAPSHASTTGMASRSSVANQQGANKRGFCPPGQAKKAGRGSAFNCWFALSGFSWKRPSPWRPLFQIVIPDMASVQAIKK